MNSFLVSDGRGGCGQLATAGCPTRPWHRVYAPAPGAGTALAWASAGLGLEVEGRPLWLPEGPGELSGLPRELGLEGFEEDPLPRWRWRVGEARIEMLLAPQHGQPAVALRVSVFGARPGTRLLFRPAFLVRGPEADRGPGESAPAQVLAGESAGVLTVRRGGEPADFEILHPEAHKLRGPAWDRPPHVSGRWFRPALLALALPAGESVREFRVGLSGARHAAAAEVIEGERRRLGALPAAPGAGPGSPAARRLGMSLDCFRVLDAAGRPALVDRLPLDGPADPGATWRALPGALLRFGLFDAAREVLARGAHEYHALLAPDPREGRTPAAPDEAFHEWMVAGSRFVAATGDHGFVRAELWPVWLEGHRAPAPEPDSLRLAALSHAALGILAECAPGAGQAQRTDGLLEAARAARTRAAARWFDPVRGALLEPREPAGAGGHGVLTASALLALDLPSCLLSDRDARRALQALRRSLWTPRGILAIDPGDTPEGEPPGRVTLPSLMGAWFRAVQRFEPDGPTARADRDSALAGLAAALGGPVSGHVCPLLEPRSPYGPSTAFDPPDVECASLEADAGSLDFPA